MPKRDDLKKILIVGSGPIVISQACEFDYSGVQACKALREEGYEVVLVNSNPATIMTDPGMADRTYIEPITADYLELIVARERPDAILPTLGGQTGLNVSVELASRGVLERYGVEMIGARPEVIHRAEDRELFRKAVEEAGLRVPRSGFARSMDEAFRIAESIGYPVIIRPSFTLGGIGGGIAYNPEDLGRIAKEGLDASMIREIMIEESVIGWKEFELEVMRDRADNVVIICSIENVDPMGVHTGDSITVAPAQTLTDVEYQQMRDAAIRVMRAIGVETGGSNVQFAVNPSNGELVVIEMNPRVSRSSALASKATGFPIAKIAAKLAVGYTLDEIPNDITRETFASFEPAIDYCVVKIPRWTFEKFPETADVLTTSMKSVGEVMAVGRTFKEALNKAVRSLEIGSYGLGWPRTIETPEDKKAVVKGLSYPNSKRLFSMACALRSGFTVEDVSRLTGIDPWFVGQIEDLVKAERVIRDAGLEEGVLLEAKRMGFSDRYLAALWDTTEEHVRSERHRLGVTPVYKLVDTCAAEFEAYTPYYYSTYEQEDESNPSGARKVIILGSGPNRIGQGIEFDYCCVQASFALRESGYESIMINSNPETVSTDYDISSKLYFEPLTLEDVLHVVSRERPEGVIVQFGGQTPLNLTKGLADAGVKILGTQPDAIARAEDRRLFLEIVNKLRLKQPPSDTATTTREAVAIADRIGYPVLVRPSYVLGGRSMEIVYDKDALESFMAGVLELFPDNQILIDKFLEDALEVDVDSICDGSRCVICGVMEHIEEAGIHSGDSSCVLPPPTLDKRVVARIEDQTKRIALELGVRGLMNVQFAVKGSDVYVLEVNPRASRTIPFVSKAVGVSFARLATKVMLGCTLDELGLRRKRTPRYVSVKESVFPFARFPGITVALGPEMKSTGEVMGIDSSFELAFAKAQCSAGFELPTSGNVFVSVHDAYKGRVVDIVRSFSDMGFGIIATTGTASYLSGKGVQVDTVLKVSEGRPNVADAIMNGQIQLVINVSLGRRPTMDAALLRRHAIRAQVPYTTTIAAAKAIARAIGVLKKTTPGVKTLQEYHARTSKPRT